MACIGLVIFVLSVVSMPWASVGDEDVTRSEIADYYEALQEAELENFDFGGIYATWLWIVVMCLLAVAVLCSTLVVPPSKAGRMATGFLMGSIIGLAVNAADDDGRFGPRISAALLVCGAAVLHTFCQFIVFTETLDGSQGPDPGIGIWTGVIGLAIVLTGCALGTRIEPAPRVWPPPSGGPRHHGRS